MNVLIIITEYQIVIYVFTNFDVAMVKQFSVYQLYVANLFVLQLY